MGTHKNKPAPVVGGQDLRLPDNSTQEYAKLAALTEKMFPSWHVETLRRMVHSILVMARPEAVVPGVLDSALTWIPGAGLFHLHFDGKGGVMIDPESDFTPELRELGQALRLVMGTRLTVGRPGVVA